jgi:disulfide oxidoreductase YuzD
MIALISDYDTSKFTDPRPEYYKLKLHELRTKFIKDRNRTSSNDQELTRWMQENINNGYQDHWFKIQYCKVFENPKQERVTIKNIIDEVRTTKYTTTVWLLQTDIGSSTIFRLNGDVEFG